MRREVMVSGTVKLAADTEKGIAVNAAGAVVTSGIPYGFTLDKGNLGEYVAVIRLGFAPVRRVSAGGTFGETVMVSTAGQVAAATTGLAVVGTTQYAAPANGDFQQAWVNTLDGHLK